jgi:hypothetical protein
MKPHRTAFVGLMAVAVVVAGCAAKENTVQPQSQVTEPPGSTSSQVTEPPVSTSETSTGIPPDLLLPNENEGSDDADVTAWTTDNAVDKAWLLDACRPTDYPTDDDRTGFRTVSRTGPELFQARQLAVFATEEVAAEAFAGFNRALTACRTGGDAAQGTAWQWNVEPVDVGDEGFVAASKTGDAPYGNRVAVTRVGAMVFLAFDEGEYGTAEIDDGARMTQQVAEKFVASL